MIYKCFKNECTGNLKSLVKNLLTELEEREYICIKCGTIYKVCLDCEGEGFAQTENGIFDCETCQGTGLILYN